MPPSSIPRTRVHNSFGDLLAVHSRVYDGILLVCDLSVSVFLDGPLRFFWWVLFRHWARAFLPRWCIGFWWCVLSFLPSKPWLLDEAFRGDLGVLGVIVGADVVSAGLFAGDGGRAGPDEWVKDEVSFLGVQVEEIADELDRFLGRVWLPVTEAAVVEDGDAPDATDLPFVLV